MIQFTEETEEVSDNDLTHSLYLIQDCLCTPGFLLGIIQTNFWLSSPLPPMENSTERILILEPRGQYDVHSNPSVSH